MKSRFGIATAMVAVLALLLTATASASEPLADGEYSVTLGEDVVIAFTISDEGETVTVDPESLPGDFEVSEDDGSEDTTKITDNVVTVEIKTGDDGKIEVYGLDRDASVTATLPGADDVVVVSLGEGVSQLPDGFEVDIDLEDGSIEIEREDDDSSSDDAESDDADSDDDSSDESTVGTVDDDSLSDDEQSDDDDDSSDDVTESTVEPAADPSVTAPAPAVSDDDDSSDTDDDDSDDEDSGATQSNDDKSDDDDSSD